MIYVITCQLCYLTSKVCVISQEYILFSVWYITLPAPRLQIKKKRQILWNPMITFLICNMLANWSVAVIFHFTAFEFKVMYVFLCIMIFEKFRATRMEFVVSVTVGSIRTRNCCSGLISFIFIGSSRNFRTLSYAFQFSPDWTVHFWGTSPGQYVGTFMR